MDSRSRIGSHWLLATCVGIVMISCYISGVACDVPDDVVYTDLHKAVRIGDSVVLKCQFRGTPLAVYWKKGDYSMRAPTLVSWTTGDPVTGLCVGERPCRIMEMNAEFSLVIKEVSIVEQGLYVCRVTNYKEILIHNFTDISVFSPPKEPYPIINECQMISPNDTKATCTISTNQSVEISCSASGYFPDIDLYFLHGSARLYTKETIEVTNLDGTKNKTLSAIATSSEISYTCFASIPGSQEQRTTTVLVNLRTSSIASPLPTGTTIPIDKTDGSVAKVVVPVIFIILLAVICISIILWCRRKQQKGQGTYAKVPYHSPSKGKIDGIISYLELEKLVKKFDIGSLSLIVAELMEDSKGELESERTKDDLYEYLCDWKESSFGSAILLYSAMEKNNLENELQIVKDFLASTDNAVSDDDLEHICWHVHSCRETIQPIVDSLQYSSTNSTKPADNGHILAPSRCDEIRDDLQIMKRWKAMSGATMYGDEDEHTESMPSNQMIQLCRALEKAGRKTGDSYDCQVYHQLSKTFYKIRGEYKSELTDEVLKEFALSITKRHCQRLGNTLKLSADAIATRNEENLQMFRTDIMLKAWVQDQKCSNYEIRRRLRQAAEQGNRQYITVNFISKQQSEVMKLPACLTNTNEKQSPGTGRSESVSPVSRDELYRIGRYAGSKILLEFCKKYDVTVPGQQSPEGKELLFEIINVLKPTLDSEYERTQKEAKLNSPRKTLRQLLEKEHPRYACLLAMRKPDLILNVELIDLAFRLIMADVYPFAKALNISDTVLTSYRRNFGPHNLTQGTANIMKQVYTNNRKKMVTTLKRAGYSEEARALYFGFEISVGDVIEVENRVDKEELAKQLGVSDDVQSTGPDNQGKDDTLHQSVLHRWRDTVCSSTFNHRLVLADALFTMGEEQLALDIISGVYRNKGINKQVSELLVDNILVGQLPTLVKILDQTKKNEEKRLKQESPTEISNRLLAAGFYAHAHEIMAGACRGDKKAGHIERTETGNVATEELRQGGIAMNEPGTRKGEVGEKELEPVAMPKDNETKPTEGIQEANTSEEGGSQNSEDKKSLGKEATDTNNVVAEISIEESPSIKEEGSKHGKEYDKALEEEASINKTGTDGERISIADDAMQEKSGDRESKENTTENVDTKEQDGSDECRRDESSKLLFQART